MRLLPTQPYREISVGDKYRLAFHMIIMITINKITPATAAIIIHQMGTSVNPAPLGNSGTANVVA